MILGHFSYDSMRSPISPYEIPRIILSDSVYHPMCLPYLPVERVVLRFVRRYSTCDRQRLALLAAVSPYATCCTEAVYGDTVLATAGDSHSLVVVEQRRRMGERGATTLVPRLYVMGANEAGYLLRPR